MTTANQSAAERNITLVAVANIQPSNYNPRKRFDETGLDELAESIKQQGVLQPITVRPIANTGRYEIVFGERRYRATVIAGSEEIPAIISELSDEEAQEMAVTENLQRKDVTPTEEANAYKQLIDSGRHTVETLSVLFGKSENYIRTRLNFSILIPELAELLDADIITISVASEICRYGEDVQREVYENHLKEGILHHSSWRGRKAKEIAELIEQKFTIDLERYAFDKTECASCRHNTNNLLLFNDGGCGQCANRACLSEMNAAFLKEKAMQIVQQQPDITLCRDPYFTNETTVERLIASGYDVETINNCITFPKSPIVPLIEDYDNSEDYEEALKDYEEEQADYIEICNEISRRNEAGEITLYAKIGERDITLCYVEKTAAQIAGSDKAAQTIAAQIAELEQKDKRNKEIAAENIVDDVKKVIREIDTTETKFGADEDRMMYFFLLSSLRKENYAAVGIDKECDYLKDEEKMDVIANLTAKTKAIIRRDFLIANFKDAFRNNGSAALLLDFAKKHMPEELADITNKYNEVYEKRHIRLEERKAALLEQTEETEQPQSEEVPQQATEEQQSEVAA
ncbi:ParB/RepB/Spo0J family partition protein [Bacteroides thetaiotaomicron]|uniref:ParB/RepB/Spo0J family partition protein n=1 Tax=Bacteroides thetaiotaomicron TaxID=818 RepID=A0AAP3SGQ0_BACT4|nr:ParB/RepB/Spo0J family partition protein [Bacteroides thetaiotaomicron]MDC2222851.1 ParB/RepB/Spo0J family partition protein [Bacteroides thetaiotaomicron]MDC2228427.1 ParB/RepB/Spo0J family partition protein [Bacteroides thetaiotaomicron]MDC2238154.1 ParB/RepB/Spo0J family partition protein [Bacteroides thetaiotaomicron]